MVEGAASRSGPPVFPLAREPSASLLDTRSGETGAPLRPASPGRQLTGRALAIHNATRNPFGPSNVEY